MTWLSAIRYAGRQISSRQPPHLFPKQLHAPRQIQGFGFQVRETSSASSYIMTAPSEPVVNNGLKQVCLLMCVASNDVWKPCYETEGIPPDLTQVHKVGIPVMDILGEKSENCRKIKESTELGTTSCADLSIPVTSGSLVYFVGGGVIDGSGYTPLNRVVAFDTSNPSAGFQECPPMIEARGVGTGVVVLGDGKIYVFGGMFREYYYDNHVFGECYDPVAKEWKPLAEPPMDDYEGPQLVSFYAFALNDKDIMVGAYLNRSICFIYDVQSDSYRCNKNHPIPHDVFPDEVISGAVKVGDVLYGLHLPCGGPLELEAYDLKSKQSYSCVIQGFSRRPTKFPFGLVYLGGENVFCFFTIAEVGSESTLVDCRRFQVEFTKDGCSMNVRLLLDNVTTLSFPSKLDPVLNALPLRE